MRNNQLVTQRENDVPAANAIVSRTDAKEVLTFVNDDFVSSSGYLRDELIGQQHSIVRHPDVPAEVFCDLWDTLSKGRTWTGLVEYRCKIVESVSGYPDPFEPSRTSRGRHQNGVA